MRASLLQTSDFRNKTCLMFVSIDEIRIVTSIATENATMDALIVPVLVPNDALIGAKIHKIHNRHKKRIYVITEVTEDDTKGFTLASSRNYEAEGELKVLPDNNAVFKVGSEDQTNFKASEVTIAIKALYVIMFLPTVH